MLTLGRALQIMSRVRARIEVCRVTGCWVWQGPTSGDGRGGGYGRMSLNGQTVAVHRVVFTHYYGYIPGRKHIDHKCGNRLCCNPLHLEMVSHRENMRRRDRSTSID